MLRALGFFGWFIVLCFPKQMPKQWGKITNSHNLFFPIEIGKEWDHVHMNVCQSVQMTNNDKTKVINRSRGQWKVVVSFLKLRSVCSLAWVYHKTDENNAIKLLLFWIFSRRRQLVFWQNTILIHLFLFTSLVKVWF